MRLFVALSIPADARENLSSLISDLQRADAQPRWINPENLHVTLKFIGEVPSENVAAMGDALATVRTAQPVDLEFRDIEFFPDARRPSVAWVGIESSQNLAVLAAEVNRVLTPLGIPREEKPFVPHLTIVRFKETCPSPALLAEIGTKKESNFGGFQTGEFHLIESKLKNTGAEYTTLHSFRFAPEEREG
jgi:RNA 2',3'-cyclic 3'-phosphodiesterase